MEVLFRVCECRQVCSCTQLLSKCMLTCIHNCMYVSVLMHMDLYMCVYIYHLRIFLINMPWKLDYKLLLQAMKIVNMMRLKEEFDYESLCRKLESQIDHLTAEVERLEKLRENDKGKLERQLKECEDSFSGAEKSLMKRSEVVDYCYCYCFI